MSHLDFSHIHSYSSNSKGISLPIVLRSNGTGVDVLAIVDTGASNCLFQRAHGEVLGLEIEAGERQTFATAAGRVTAFGHVVSLEVMDLKFESLVYFFADEMIRKNLLGRMGWLDRVRLGLVDHDHQLYLAPYDFEPE
jgi:predicted aspartyl protease